MKNKNGKIITLTAKDDSPSFADNEHQIILKEETQFNFVGWPNPTDIRNSDQWKPGKDPPLTYSKTVWKIKT